MYGFGCSNVSYGFGVGNAGGFGAAGYGGVVSFGSEKKSAPAEENGPHGKASLELELVAAEMAAPAESECVKVFNLFGAEVL